MNIHNSYKNPDLLSLLDLPNEVLVKIMSLLPETRDRVKLRCVSRRLRSISETPSLWRDFEWSDCNHREEKHLYNVMKTCGAHINRLSFPERLVQSGALPIAGKDVLKLTKMSEMAKMLQCCRNLTHLSLPALNSPHGDEQLKEAIQEMKYLEVLSIHCYDSFQPYFNLRIKLKELTIHTLIPSNKYIEITEEWSFDPPNLNIVILNGSMHSTLIKFREFLLSAWLRWNSQIPAGHAACLKLYINYTIPLNLFHNVPVFQLEYGETATLPFVQASSVGITDKWLLLTEHDDGRMMVRKAKMYPEASHAMHGMLHDCRQDNQLQLDDNVTNLTELDLSKCIIDFKLILSACPQLQRLNLQNNINLKPEDLQVIVTCYNLKGLNLMGIPVTDIDLCLKVWETVSSMKLTHLSVDASFIGNLLEIDATREKQLVTFFKQCTTLLALELCGKRFTNPFTTTDYKLVSHFPSLEYCRLRCSRPVSCAENILSTCKSLRCFYCSCSEKLSLSWLHHNNLQQLCLSSKLTAINDTFMDAISAHGGLAHVAVFVHSVTSEGITTLIKNSPNLLTFVVHEQKQYNESYFKSLNASVSERFANRRLFTRGLFSLIRQPEDDEHVEYNEWLQNTDLVSLWPPDQFPDLHFQLH